jgi:hypothetical protein
MTNRTLPDDAGLSVHRLRQRRLEQADEAGGPVTCLTITVCLGAKSSLY